MTQSHHVEPSPYIHSNVRRYVAPEMQDKRIKPVGYTKPAGKRVSVHELSRILREKIIALLSDGEKWSAKEVAEVLESSQTSTRRHLNCLVDLGIARCTPGYIRTCREQLKYWINKTAVNTEKE